MIKFITNLTLLNVLLAVLSCNTWNIVFAISIFVIGEKVTEKWEFMN